MKREKNNQLIRVTLKDGRVLPILDVTASDVDDLMELVENEDGTVSIAAKDEMDVSDKRFGL